MYCESTAAQYPMDSENHKLASTMVMDFWGRVTPGILQMLNTPKEVRVTDELWYRNVFVQEVIVQSCSIKIFGKAYMYANKKIN